MAQVPKRPSTPSICAVWQSEDATLDVVQMGFRPKRGASNQSLFTPKGGGHEREREREREMFKPIRLGGVPEADAALPGVPGEELHPFTCFVFVSVFVFLFNK